MENEIEKEYVQNLREEYTEHKRDQIILLFGEQDQY